jgi:heat shock protein HslJ
MREREGRRMRLSGMIACTCILVLVLACSGCIDSSFPGQYGGAVGGFPEDLTSVTWVLDLYVGGDAQFKPVLNDTQITAVFGTDGLLSGSGGCNIYAAQYETEEELLSIGPVASAKTICSEPLGLMNQETTYLNALESVAAYEISGDDLRLLDRENRTVLVFSRGNVSAPAELTGRTWRLTHFDNGMGKIMPVVDGTTVTAYFDHEGFLRGSAGCNAYATTCRADNGMLDIGIVDVTQMFCSRPAGIMQQEGTYLSMLEQADSYEVDDNHLIIRDKDGDTILIFESERSESIIPLGGTLTGRTWHLRRLADNAGEMVPALSQATVTAVFSEDGHLSGAAGCNWYGTYYRTEGEQLFIEDIAYTDFHCSSPEGILQQEQRYFSLMDRVAAYDIQDRTLILYDENEDPLLEYSGDPLGR